MIFAGLRLVVAVVASGGFASFWYHQVDESKRSFAHTVDALNRQARGKPGEPALLRYGTITADGFPFRVTLTVRDVRARIPVTRLLGRMRGESLPARNARVPWTEEFRAETITVSRSIFSRDRVDVRLVAPLHERTLIGGRERGSTVTTAKDWTCGARADDDATRLAELTCRIADRRIVDARTRAPIADLAEFTLAWSDARAGDARRASLRMRTRGERYHPAADRYARLYADNVFALAGTAARPRDLINPAAFGTIASDVDVAYDGPGAKRGFGVVPLRLDIAHLDFSSALSNTRFSLHLLDDAAAKRHRELRVHARADVGDAYAALMRARYRRDAATARDPREAAIYRVAAAAVPHLETLRPLTLDIDGTYDARTTRDYELRLRTAALGARPYGVEAHGASVVENGRGGTDVRLTVRDADRLITDLGHYGRRVEAALSARRRSFTPETVEAARGFIEGLDPDYARTKPDLHLRFERADDGPFTVNGRDLGGLFGRARGVAAGEAKRG